MTISVVSTALLSVGLIALGSTSAHAVQKPTYQNTFFVDVTGDGKADAVGVGSNYIGVLPSNGSSFGGYQTWHSGAFAGEDGVYFADVTGDGKADAIAVSVRHSQVQTVSVLPSTGSTFGASQTWFAGSITNTIISGKGTFVADVTGDGKADLVEVGDNGIQVAPSTGTSFGGAQFWLNSAFYGSHGTYFADVNGDGKADAVGIGDNYIGVMLSTGSGFGTYQTWCSGAFYGSQGTYFADVNGDGKADAVGIGTNYIGVLLSSGTAFGSYQTWSSGTFYGSHGTYIADISGDHKADAVGVGDSYIGALLSTGSAFGSYQSWNSGAFYGSLSICWDPNPIVHYNPPCDVIP